MNTKVLFRKIHHWGSLLIMLQAGVIFIAGIFLMLKKDFAWIQPPTQRGTASELPPQITIAELYEIAKAAAPEANINSWTDLSRVDIKPDKYVVKFVSNTNWEVQIDINSGDVVQKSFRRSDIIESIHDGSFFGDGAKRYLFLPAGVILVFLWMTGIYLFFLPHYARWRRRKKRASKAQL